MWLLTSSSIVLFAFVFALPPRAAAQSARYIDPFLGVEGGGNAFPGVTLPFGMVKAGPDIGANSSNAGWAAEGDINGFSQTHVSGTGGGAKYGNILIHSPSKPKTFQHRTGTWWLPSGMASNTIRRGSGMKIYFMVAGWC